MEIIRSIQNRIYEIRGGRVMLDFDIAALYGVETRVLNQAVKRNGDRFPEDFMFQLTGIEWQLLSKQIIHYQSVNAPSSQFVMISLPKNRSDKYLPFAFTEQGVSMVSGVLRSERAVQMHIAIMRAFVAVRKVLIEQNDFREQIRQIREKLGEHDAQLSQIYEALENMLDEKAEQRKWEDRVRIGFKK
jgi:ORF6N domain